MTPRRQRQADQLRDLCRSGSLARAIDLAFEHFADFGRSDEILALLAAAIEQAPAPERLRLRLAELSDPGGLSGDSCR